VILRRFPLLFSLLVLAACPKEESPGPVPELPRIVLVNGPATNEWSRVPLGSELVIEVELRLADGSLATDYAFAWGGPIDAPVGFGNLTVKREKPGPGRERLVLSSSSYYYIPGIGCRVQVVDPANGLPTADIDTLGPFNVVFWGGAPAGVALPPGELRLGVGEERPFVPLAGPVVEEGQLKGKPSHLPVTVTSNDPAIVKVEADGVTLTAVAQGSTTLTVKVGTLTQAVPVTVDGRALGAPSETGFRPAAARAAGLSYFPIVYHTAGAVRGDHLVALDGRGYPYLTAKVNFTLWLAGWTGTDAGWEPVSAPGEEVDDPGATTVDARGRLYVAYRTFGAQLVLAERQASGRASTWTRRPLFPISELWTDPAWQPTYSDYGDFVVHPRAGGGVWVAHHREYQPASGPDQCKSELWLHEVTDAAVKAERIASGVRAGKCEVGSFQGRWQTHLFLVGVRPGKTKPDLVAGLFPGSGVEGWWFANADGTYARETLLTMGAKPARPADAGAMGSYLPYDAATAARLPADAPRILYQGGVSDFDRYTAGAVYLVDGGGALKVGMAARLHGGKAVGMRWFNDTLVDAVTPFEVTAFP